MIRPSRRLLRSLTAVMAAACSPPGATPRYAINIFAEDTVATAVTVSVTGPMQVSLDGAGFYMYRGQPVVLTPASLVVRGSGTATIASIDSSRPLAAVPAGMPLDSTDAAALVGRLLRVSRSEGDNRYKFEVVRP